MKSKEVWMENFVALILKLIMMRTGFRGYWWLCCRISGIKRKKSQIFCFFVKVLANSPAFLYSKRQYLVF